MKPGLDNKNKGEILEYWDQAMNWGEFGDILHILKR